MDAKRRFDRAKHHPIEQPVPPGPGGAHDEVWRVVLRSFVRRLAHV
jgi:hypothetical protein